MSCLGIACGNASSELAFIERASRTSITKWLNYNLIISLHLTIGKSWHIWIQIFTWIWIISKQTFLLVSGTALAALCRRRNAAERWLSDYTFIFFFFCLPSAKIPPISECLYSEQVYNICQTTMCSLSKNYNELISLFKLIIILHRCFPLLSRTINYPRPFELTLSVDLMIRWNLHSI